jgi:hypothetical protein
LLNLPKLATNVLDDDEMYDRECRRFQVDVVRDIGEEERIDHWWGDPVLSEKYPSLAKMVKAVLCCFHGPQVEASFSSMTDIIDSKSNRLNAETFSAIQTVRYELSASGKSAVEYFQKKDFLHEKVDATLCKNMVAARKNYAEELEEKQRLKEEHKEELKINRKTVSKRKMNEMHAKASKKGQNQFFCETSCKSQIGMKSYHVEINRKLY